MKNLYQSFKTDAGLEMDGVFLDFGGPRIRIRRAGGANRLYSSVFSEVSRPHAQALAARALAPEKQREMMLEVYFKSVVIGWENVTDEEGNELAFTFDNFKKIMYDLPDLWEVVRDEADNRRNFQLEAAKNDGKTLGE